MALFPRGDIYYDWLEPMGVSLDEYCDEFLGSWMFGYVDALERAGVRTMIVAMTDAVSSFRSCRHGASGAEILLLPHWRIRHPPPPNEPNAQHGGFGDPPKRSVARRARSHLAPYIRFPYAALARQLRARHCRALLTQDYEWPGFDAAVLLGRLMRAPTFGTFQGGSPVSRLEPLVRPMSLRASRGLIIGDERELDRMKRKHRLPDVKITRIFNPVDAGVWRPTGDRSAREELGIPSDARVAVWHGRVEIPKKGLDVLLRAWQQVLSSTPELDLRLLLIGTGRDANDLGHLLSGQLGSSVHWIPEFIDDQERLRRYLNASDVCVFASRFEGFPVAPLEAMACGLPLVSTDTPGVRDVLCNGYADGGVLVPRGSASRLAEELTVLLSDREQAQHVGRSARDRINRPEFAPESVGRHLRSFMLGGAPA